MQSLAEHNDLAIGWQVSLKPAAKPLRGATDKQFRVGAKALRGVASAVSGCTAVNKNKCHKEELRRQMHQSANRPAAAGRAVPVHFQRFELANK